MQTYNHYSGFLVPAETFKNKSGIPYGNGWIIDNSNYTPWYLSDENKHIDKLTNLPTEMTAFVPIAAAVMIIIVFDYSVFLFIFSFIDIPNQLEDELIQAIQIKQLGALITLNVSKKIIESMLSTTVDINQRHDLVLTYNQIDEQFKKNGLINTRSCETRR